ncbi:MAG: hypothetical protein M3P27_13445 [Acidobacteriota bacterium]|nr:hypothetical protein [Acidobacteriota bacterium]
MSMAAIWRTGCCRRLFVSGRYRGNAMSQHLEDCDHCRAADGSPRKQVPADFVTYMDDARLTTTDVRRRHLTAAESQLVEAA